MGRGGGPLEKEPGRPDFRQKHQSHIYRIETSCSDLEKVRQKKNGGAPPPNQPTILPRESSLLLLAR